MTKTAFADLPLIISAKELSEISDNPALVVVDVSTTEQFAAAHIPGARHLEYKSIIRAQGKANGLLVEPDNFANVLAGLGITQDSNIVAYDQGGGGAASRFIWTLHAYALENCKLLSGGLSAWIAAGQDAQIQVASIDAAPPMNLRTDRSNVVNTDELIKQLDSSDAPDILDARSANEFNGSDVRSTRGGHVPGAIHFEWTDALDKNNHLQLLPDPELTTLVAERGFDRKRPVVAYCQTHQRSSLSYVMLKHLGFEKVSGLEGAWSEWGNRDDTPIET